jgi:hypothetical protein
VAAQQVKLFDLLAKTGGAIDPRNAKVHLATHNGQSDPLDVFYDGSFQGWQADQSRKNFGLNYIVSLIKLGGDRWLFAGVYSTRGCRLDTGDGRYKYDTVLESSWSGLMKRCVVSFDRHGSQQPYPLAKNCHDELFVVEVHEQPLTREECVTLRRRAGMSGLDIRAASILRALVDHVYEHDDVPLVPITYEQLAERLGRLRKDGRPWPRGMDEPLTRMGHLLTRLEGEWHRDIPQIQGIVVSKNSGVPNKGIEVFWPDYAKLSKAEKLVKLQHELDRIDEFGNLWDEVLKEFGLEATRRNKVSASAKPGRYGSGGESVEHKALKAYVRNHPPLVKASRTSRRTIEYALPSGDEVDVFFRHRDECVAVEVKSIVSERVKNDCRRGVYQTIKYLAVLKAMASVREWRICSNIRSVLVLQGKLAPQLKRLADHLGVEIFDGIEVPRSYLARARASNKRRY